jgi:predicted small integral membrane protein
MVTIPTAVEGACAFDATNSTLENGVWTPSGAAFFNAIATLQAVYQVYFDEVLHPPIMSRKGHLQFSKVQIPQLCIVVQWSRACC